MPADPTFVEREPPESLRGVVTRLWHLRMPSPQRFEQIVPMPAVHLIVNLSDPYRIIRRGRDTVDEPHAGAFISGVQTDYLVNENPSELHHVGAEFTPWALPVFGIAAPDVAGRVVPAAPLLEGVAAVRDIDGLAHLLTERLDPNWRADRRVVDAATELLAHPETAIASLVERSGIGATRFVAVFRAACGVTPKRFAEVCRHHRFLSELPVDGPLPSWTELIATHGYYDQPHFIREFRRFTGMTPSAYLERRGRSEHDDPSFLALGEV